jgi:hypothetical protein
VQEEKYLRDKGYWKAFEKSDQKILMDIYDTEKKQRKLLKEEWNKLRNEQMSEYQNEGPLRRSLRPGEVDSDEEDDYETIEILVEEEVSRTEEVVSMRDYIKASTTAPAAAAAVAASSRACM